MTPIDYIVAPVAPVGAQTAKRFGESPLYWLALASASTILISIAVSQILLGLCLLVSILSRKRLRWPPIVLPLAILFFWTILADLLSGDARAGLPQIRKFFVFAIVPVMYTAFESVSDIRRLIWTCCGFATLSAIAAIAQFVHRWREGVQLRWDLYDYVLDARVKGFADHWMTFGGEQMIVLLMLIALLLFSRRGWWTIAGAGAALIIWIAIVLGLTRSIFLVGVPSGALVIAWYFKRWVVFAMPVVIVALLLLSPVEIRERVISVVRPHGEVDSNSRRTIMARTGLRMISAHPWFGLGPEQIQPQFLNYVPSDVPKPLPKGWYGHLHNIYLQYAAERGIPGLILILWMIGKMTRDFRAALHGRPEAYARFVSIGALAVIAAVLAEGFFEYNLGDSEVLTLFLTMTTCGYVVLRRTQPVAS